MKNIDNNVDKKTKIAEALSKNMPISAKTSTQSVDDLQIDYDVSRETYKELIDKGNKAIDLMMDLASDSQHPRAFEVLATLLKTQADNTDKLADLQKKMQNLTTPKDSAKKQQSGNTTNNNVFVGSTTDLQRFILDQQNKNMVIDVNSSEHNE